MLSCDYIGAFRILGGLPLADVYRKAEFGRATLARSVRGHPVFKLCHEDPYTARAFNKPRGYAGDAVMLDYMVKRGGRLLIGNFAQGAVGERYLSLFMDWHLNYRTEAQIRSLLPCDHGAAATVALDPHGNVFYALLTVSG